jgi:hypothetical protein
VVVELAVGGLPKNPDPKILLEGFVVVAVGFVVFPDPELDAVFSGVGKLKMLMMALKEVAVQSRTSSTR